MSRTTGRLTCHSTIGGDIFHKNRTVAPVVLISSDSTLNWGGAHPLSIVIQPSIITILSKLYQTNGAAVAKRLNIRNKLSTNNRFNHHIFFTTSASDIDILIYLGI
jgi:hypothetical protein